MLSALSGFQQPKNAFYDGNLWKTNIFIMKAHYFDGKPLIS
jgi:hypothetical protein